MSAWLVALVGTIYSANNFIRAGYRLFEPECRWAFESSLYWKKQL